MGEFGAELESVVGKEGNRASPERDVPVDQYVGRAGSGELSLSSSVHVGAPAETVGEEENVGVAPRCQRERTEVVDADEDARAVG